MEVRRLALGAIALLVVLVWLVALPWVARQPTVNARLQWLDRNGIDAAATFYTELPAMEQILRRQRPR